MYSILFFARSSESLQDTNLRAFLISSLPLINETSTNIVVFAEVLLVLLL
jgi:hypothetical protein